VVNSFGADLEAIDATRRPSAVQKRIAFDELYTAHFEFVFRTARRLGVQEANVDDIVQEVFLVLHRRLDDFDGRASMRAWIYGILANIVREYRRMRRRKESQLSWLDPDDATVAAVATAGAEPVEQMERREAARLLFRMLDDLDDDKREVLILTELEQMSVAEVSELLGENVNTLYSRLKAAKKALVRAYQREKARAHRGSR
jgi:RNA polymerase sigma-70 factor, ECF subfamily